MSTPTHILAGLVLSQYLQKFGLVTGDPNTITAISVISANIPDLDTIVTGINYTHRTKSLSHFPINWYAALFIVYLMLFFGFLTIPMSYFLVAFLGLSSHFLLDTVGVNSGICWLWPIRIKEFSLCRIFPRPSSRIKRTINYLKHPGFKYELSTILICLILLRVFA